MPPTASEAIVLGNGYGGFVALQMAIRHPGIASQACPRRLRRGVFGSRAARRFATWRRRRRPRDWPAITDVAMRRLFAPEFQEAHPDLMRDRREAFLKTDPDVFRAACDALAELDLRPELGEGQSAGAGAGRRA